jgi:uncharacterized repeat protein (TIGR01451 family)
MNARVQVDNTGAAPRRGSQRLALGLLFLLLAWGSAAPAGATSGTIYYTWTGSLPIYVNTGETLNIVDGAQISGTAGVDVNGGTANISGGTISGTSYGVYVAGGTVTISGGSISGGDYGVEVNEGGTVSISGGSISGGNFGVVVNELGTATIFGCNLLLSGGTLTGTLQDGTPISTTAVGAGTLTLINEPPQITCPASMRVFANSAPCSALVNPGMATASACATVSFVRTNPDGTTASGTLPDTGGLLTAPYALGTTTITWTATASGVASQCPQTITVLPSADLAISKVAQPTTPVSGRNLTYTLTVTNYGPCAASGVVITDPLPGGTVFLGAVPSANVGSLSTPPLGKGGTVSWNVGALGSGQSVTLAIVVKVTAKGGSTLTNTASVSSSTADPNPANNSATVQTRVQ